MNGPLTPERLLRDPENRKAYRVWVNSPMTQQVLEAAKLLALPSHLNTVNAESALYNHGVCVGANQLLRFMSEMELWAPPDDATADVVATYGADLDEHVKYLKEFKRS